VLVFELLLCNAAVPYQTICVCFIIIIIILSILNYAPGSKDPED